MKKVTVILSTVLALLLTPATLAATTKVKWTNPDDYHDIYAGEEHRAKFKAQVFSSLEKHFAKLAQQLPEGQRLNIEVTDLDLAGDVHIGGIRRIRIIKELFYPRIEFSYQLFDSSNHIISSDKINLKDMNFMYGSTLRYRNERFGYEKRMLDDWFKKTFSDDTAK
ncbi:hypothetical protein tinsulaeT_23270 [Thalassotalea insulae]|uniref:DUF3016 domain-containing protein n=2 Tax=Thalassotalea insulae TaxID=2056778 RepID=A0ABQ6GSV1_9GAMM|nr:hypothetical protein tinsulaeT_23270 [Thalassotalea insulae]